MSDDKNEPADVKNEDPPKSKPIKDPVCDVIWDDNARGGFPVGN